MNPEICLFRSLSEAEKRVPRGFVWVMGKEGLFGGAGFFGSDHLSMGSHQESKEHLNSSKGQNTFFSRILPPPDSYIIPLFLLYINEHTGR
jgi:hypothetical protein